VISTSEKKIIFPKVRGVECFIGEIEDIPEGRRSRATLPFVESLVEKLNGNNISSTKGLLFLKISRKIIGKSDGIATPFSEALKKLKVNDKYRVRQVTELQDGEDYLKLYLTVREPSLE
jgi:hypothetical protein